MQIQTITIGVGMRQQGRAKFFEQKQDLSVIDDFIFGYRLLFRLDEITEPKFCEYNLYCFIYKSTVIYPQFCELPLTND